MKLTDRHKAIIEIVKKFEPITSDEIALILNVKISPEGKETLLQKEGVFEAYHMNKKHWISIALNVCKDEAFIQECVENSYKCIC